MTFTALEADHMTTDTAETLLAAHDAIRDILGITSRRVHSEHKPAGAATLT